LTNEVVIPGTKSDSFTRQFGATENTFSIAFTGIYDVTVVNSLSVLCILCTKVGFKIARNYAQIMQFEIRNVPLKRTKCAVNCNPYIHRTLVGPIVGDTLSGLYS